MPRKRRSPKKKKSTIKRVPRGWIKPLVMGLGLLGLVLGSFSAGAYWGGRRAVADKMRSLPNKMREELDAYWNARLQSAQAQVNEATEAAGELAKKSAKDLLERSLSSLGEGQPVPEAKEAPKRTAHPYAHAFDFSWPMYSVEDAIAEHNILTVCYAPQALQARWVAYTIQPNVRSSTQSTPKRAFQADPMLTKWRMPVASDYDPKYEMVSLVSPKERSEHPKRIEECFYMSLVCPQTPALSAVWRTLSERTYRWALHHAPLYVVAGPVLAKAARMKQSRVRIPNYFFKALLVLDETEPKAIGFLIPQTPDPTQSIMTYACSLRDIEKQTGLVLFPHLPSELSDKLKAAPNLTLWP